MTISRLQVWLALQAGRLFLKRRLFLGKVVSAKSTVPEDVYIDAQCPASDAGRRFFGWLMASAM